MAVPGFSITELIQAARHVKTAYNAFFSEESKSPALLLELANDIKLFENNLEKHKTITEGVDRPIYDAVKLTLDQCATFLNEYKILLEGKKVTPGAAWKTVRYAYDQDKVNRL